MKYLFLCFLTFAYANSIQINPTLDIYWEMFKVKFNKSYEPEESLIRRRIWEQNADRIFKHNLEFDFDMHDYILGLNQFADLTHEEFIQALNGLKPINRTRGSENFTFNSTLDIELSSNVDWRNEYVTDAKNQHHCASSWAFSVVGSLEGQYKKKFGNLMSLSAQNLIDCASLPGNDGCNGGSLEAGFEYVKENGINVESVYPYEAKVGECRYRNRSDSVTSLGFVNLPSGDEEILKKAVATIGPISAVIDASSPKLQLYNGGIYYDPNCSSTIVNQAILIVGYGSWKGNDYWLIKNSWGKDWGVNGYAKLSRNKGNHCGIATQASYPVM